MNSTTTAEQRILKALKSRPSKLCLDNSNLHALPVALGRLAFLTSLSAKNNSLRALPSEMASLSSLSQLNLGRNELVDIEPLLDLGCLTILHLFSNRITTLPANFFRSLTKLQLLNLNSNHLSSLSEDVVLLQGLRQLSLSTNHLSHLPSEIGELSSLEELYLDGNSLPAIPESVGALTKLKKLCLQKNQLHSLPETIGKCRKLLKLDVSCNKLELFPSTLAHLDLQEFHCEHNSLLPHLPVPADQVKEVMKLEELASRKLVKGMKDSEDFPQVLDSVPEHICTALRRFGRCAVCGEPYVHTWLQCVEFRPAKDVLPSLRCTSTGVSHLPLSAALCSYHCFNSEGHNYLGIATSL